jgi:hypothetical protein
MHTCDILYSKYPATVYLWPIRGRGLRSWSSQQHHKHKHMVYKTWLQTKGKRVAMLFGLRNRWKAFSISMNRRPICVLYHRENDLGRECLDNNIQLDIMCKQTSITIQKLHTARLMQPVLPCNRVFNFNNPIIVNKFVLNLLLVKIIIYWNSVHEQWISIISNWERVFS